MKRYRIINKFRFAIFVFLIIMFIVWGFSNLWNDNKIAIGAPLKTSSEWNPEKNLEKIIVKSGDTLWGISKRYLGDRSANTDIRYFIHQIEALNDLRNGEIRSGDVLYMPASENL